MAAGYTVLLPNPRGSTGRGEAFLRANVGDFGGGDLRDLVAGVEWARVELFAGEPVPAAIAGASYGGYSPAGRRPSAACSTPPAAIAVISDLVSRL